MYATGYIACLIIGGIVGGMAVALLSYGNDEIYYEVKDGEKEKEECFPVG